jgi:hypothetical protein
LRLAPRLGDFGDVAEARAFFISPAAFRIRFWNAIALRSVLNPFRFLMPNSSRQSAIHNEPRFFNGDSPLWCPISVSRCRVFLLARPPARNPHNYGPRTAVPVEAVEFSFVGCKVRGGFWTVFGHQLRKGPVLAPFRCPEKYFRTVGGPFAHTPEASGKLKT